MWGKSFLTIILSSRCHSLEALVPLFPGENKRVKFLPFCLLNNTNTRPIKKKSVVNGTGLPNDVTGIRNAPDNPEALYLPQGSFCDAFDQQNGDDLYSTRIIGTTDLSEDDAQSLITTSLNSMKQAGTYSVGTPNVVAFTSHGQTVPKLSGADLKAGVLNQLYSLQGRRSTYWTGLSWAPDYTPILWDFNEKIFPQILEGL